MIRLQRIWIKILIVLICIVIIPDGAYGQDTSHSIKVGIRFGQSATPVVSLKSQTGLELVKIEDGEKNVLMTFSPNQDIFMRKDGYFIDVNRTYVEYDFKENEDDYDSNIKGPIHIQIGSKFESQQQAQEFLDEIKNSIDHVYLVYEDGWGVWQGLYKSFSDAEEAFESIKVRVHSQDLRIIPKDEKRVQVLKENGEVVFMYNTSDDKYAFCGIENGNTPGIIQLDGKKFRGHILINRYTNSDLTVINELDIDEYLYGVVPKEMSGQWPIEAQKSQAVAARSYIYVNKDKHKEYGFDVCANTHCQVYGGYSVEHPLTRKAVDETRGKVLTYNGKIIEALYHSNSGGHTEDSENVYTNALEYLRGVQDPYSIGAPNDQWTKVYTKDQIHQILASHGLDVGEVKHLSIEEYSNNKRVMKLKVYGSNGTQILQKGQIRSIFGYNNIKSTWFEMDQNEKGDLVILSSSYRQGDPSSLQSIYVLGKSRMNEVSQNDLYLSNGKTSKFVHNDSQNNDSNEVVFSGKGWGHGLGMSQWGAKKMAEQGMNYEDILRHYYTGITIDKEY